MSFGYKLATLPSHKVARPVLDAELGPYSKERGEGGKTADACVSPEGASSEAARSRARRSGGPREA